MPTVAPIGPVHREHQARSQPRQPDNTQETQLKLTRKQSKYLSIQEPQESALAPSLPQASSEEAPVLRSDGIYIDDQGQVRLYEYTDPVEPVEVVKPIEQQNSSAGETQDHGLRTNLSQLVDAQLATTKAEQVVRPTLSNASEPEEYWDDEGDENYDEEGYVTARSFKSRGDNTTGGATTVLFPKLNQKAKKEIAAAKDLIEGLKTQEELEDEAWDTTMVAEYGEEIFGYMKDLEVTLSTSGDMHLC